MPQKIFSAATIDKIEPTVINNSEDIINLDISITTSSTSKNAIHYIQIMMTKEGSSDYFGLTKNTQGEWFAFKTPPTDYQTYLFNFVPGDLAWSGKINAKIDTSSPNFRGSGNYLIKYRKYITSATSYVDSNEIPFAINIATPPSQTEPTPVPTQEQKPVSEIKISLDDKKFLDEKFTVKTEAKNLAKETEFYVKIRGGLEESKLTRARTQNGSSWLSDGESWSSFSIIKTNSDGNWSGEIYGMIDGEKDPGNYKVRVRLRNISTESNYDSEVKEMELIKPTPIVTPTVTPTPTPKPTIVISSKSAEVLTGLHPADGRGATLSGEVLGTKSGELKQNPPFVAVGLILFGLSLILGSVVKYRHGIKIAGPNP